MSEVLEQEELKALPLEQAFQVLFEAHEGIPPGLSAPARTLARAEETGQDAWTRLNHVAEMSRTTEAIFRDYLSPLSVVGNQPQATTATWPIALARWTELLHYRANKLLANEVMPELANTGFRVLPVTEAMDEFGEWIHGYFQEHIYPLLTPLAVDPGRPFPFISSDSLNLLVELRGGIRHEPAALLARVKIPAITPRLIRLPNAASAAHAAEAHVWSVDIVRHFVTELFVGVPIRRVHCFRVLRAPDTVDADQPHANEIRGRKARGTVVRVDVDSDMPSGLFDWLVDHLDVISYSVVRYDAPNLMMSLPQLAEAVQAWRESAAGPDV